VLGLGERDDSSRIEILLDHVAFDAAFGTFKLTCFLTRPAEVEFQDAMIRDIRAIRDIMTGRTDITSCFACVVPMTILACDLGFFAKSASPIWRNGQRLACQPPASCHDSMPRLSSELALLCSSS
jgi:hypothetical protein